MVVPVELVHMDRQTTWAIPNETVYNADGVFGVGTLDYWWIQALKIYNSKLLSDEMVRVLKGFNTAEYLNNEAVANHGLSLLSGSRPELHSTKVQHEESSITNQIMQAQSTQQGPCQSTRPTRI